MRWHGLRATVVANEHAMTTLVMPPVDPYMLRHRLQVVDLPVQRIAAHGDEKLGSCIHEK